MNKSRNIVTGVCKCNGNLNPINQKGECKYQASTGCGLWLTSLSFRQFMNLSPRNVFANMFTKMWTGVMWTSQIVVTTQRHPNQGLVGSGPVRRVIPIERKKIKAAGKERGKM